MTARPLTRPTARPTLGRSRFLRAAPAFLAVLAAAPAAAQTLVQVGSSTETAGVSEWTLGVGYDFDFPALPISVGVLGQTGFGRTDRLPATGGNEPTVRRSFPARAFGVVKMGLLPAPGFRLYLGLGGGVATRLRAVTEQEMNPAGLALAGFSGGRLTLEVQYQRDFAETAVNRWVYLLGVSF